MMSSSLAPIPPPLFSSDERVSNCTLHNYVYITVPYLNEWLCKPLHGACARASSRCMEYEKVDLTTALIRLFEELCKVFSQCKDESANC
jgi:hypothetical protein